MYSGTIFSGSILQHLEGAKLSQGAGSTGGRNCIRSLLRRLRASHDKPSCPPQATPIS